MKGTTSLYSVIQRRQKHQIFVFIYFIATTAIYIFAAEKLRNTIQDGGGKKAPPTSFSPVTSTNIGITP